MFYLHISNKTEGLVKQLIKIRAKSAKNDLFEKNLFIVKNEGVSRWLTQRLASNQGLFLNYEFMSVHKFFTKIVSIINSKYLDNKFESATLTWHVHSILKHNDLSKFETLHRYFENDNLGLYRFQLAQQLANIFDQYQMTRPEFLKAWENDQTLFSDHACSEIELWQKYIWHELSNQIGEVAISHADVWQQIFSLIKSMSKSEINKLPKSISVFGINTLPELELEFLKVISQHVDVHFYFLSLSQDYWLNLKPKDQSVNLKQINNPLLKNFGQQGQYFQKVLALDNKGIDISFADFGKPDKLSNLNLIQNDILLNTIPTTLQNFTADSSIQIHNCHTEVRELEVLKNEILDVLQTTDTSLREIMVMAPNIEKYVPYIEAIFSGIKHQISDESLRDSNTLIGIFEKFLTVATARFGWQEILDLLAIPEVCASFDLTEFDLQQITIWVESTNTRWAYSAEQKKELDLPADEVNTWKAGIEKMFYGYAIGDESEFVDDIFPYPEIEGSSIIILGSFYQYIKLLLSANKDFTATHTLPQWSNIFRLYSKALFQHDVVNSGHKIELLDLIGKLEDTALDFYTAEINFQVVQSWFQSQSSAISSIQGFLRGGLTFCSMLPMRAIPFKVIALLGMKEGDFPSKDNQVAFDLTQVESKQGDHSKLLEGKYQFLEILLSVREKLLIFYQGQLAENNTSLQPASVVSDLIDVMTEYYGLAENDFIIKHALQVYHYKYFDVGKQKTRQSERFYSYNDFHFSIAQKQLENQFDSKRNLASRSWWPIDGRVDFESSDIIEMKDLINFVKNPQAYFVKQVLQINLNSANLLAQEKESFVFNNLEEYLFKAEIVERISNLNSLEDKVVMEQTYQEFKAQGKLLGGEIGRLDFQDKFNQAKQYHQKFLDIEGIVGHKCEDVLFNFNIELNNDREYQMIGTLSDQYEQAMVLYRFGELKAKTLCETWIKHIVLNQVVSKTTYLIYGKNEVKILKFSAQDRHLSPLNKWLELFISGQNKPSVFMPEPGFACVSKLGSSRSKKFPTEKAYDAFQKQLSFGFEPELNLLYRGLSDKEKRLLFNDEFELICDAVLKPILEVVGL